jgi:hypothetical protein
MDDCARETISIPVLNVDNPVAAENDYKCSNRTTDEPIFMLSISTDCALGGRPMQCDYCGGPINKKVYHFHETRFPERFACSPSCYDAVVARTIGSAIFVAPRAMNLRERLSLALVGAR